MPDTAPSATPAAALLRQPMVRAPDGARLSAGGERVAGQRCRSMSNTRSSSRAQPMCCCARACTGCPSPRISPAASAGCASPAAGPRAAGPCGTRCVVPSRHGLFSSSSTCPAALTWMRSSDSAGRAMYRHSRSSRLRSCASTRTAACRLNPSASSRASVCAEGAVFLNSLSGRRERHRVPRECPQQLGIHRHQLHAKAHRQRHELTVVCSAFTVAHEFKHPPRVRLMLVPG